MRTFRITVAYDGTDFVGWQRQAAGVSIQGLLEDALRELDGRDVTVMGAGRTDAGVHALGQVAAFAIERPLAADAVVRALNARLPHTVRVLAAEEAPASFRARADARSKTYRYRIWNGDVVSPFERRFVWHVPGALDVDAMRAAARTLVGRHDFAALQTAGSDVRTTERDSDPPSNRDVLDSFETADPKSTIRNPKSSPTRSAGPVSCDTWCVRSLARWSKSGAATGLRRGWPTCSRHAIGDRPDRRRPPEACFS
jgi:tRNA pseudouridine(38-40) synthase